MKTKVSIKLPKWKLILFSLISCVLFFVALELILAVCGVRPVLYERDPYVGFSSHIPLFIEKRLPDGSSQMVTADNKLEWFNLQRFPKEKRKGTYRIFCVGGSTTYGRPYNDVTSFCGWLREFLPAVDPSRHWEVINAGGISYASYRVSVLMEELARYKPDLFVVYCGQNEFLERRTYSKIIHTPPPVRELSALASHTRTWAAMEHLIEAVSGDGKSKTNGAAQLPGEVDAVLDRSVGPSAYTRDDAMRSQVLEHYRYSLSRIVDIARSANAGVLLITPASNLRHCSPFKSENSNLTPDQLQAWRGCVERAQKAREANQLAESLKELDQAIKIDRRHAGLQYLRARTLDALGRYEEARSAYEGALEEDVCPLRALPPMRTIVSEIASERTVPLADFAMLAQRLANDGIPGNDLFLDHVHPTIEMHRRLALAIIETMGKHGYARPQAGIQSPWESSPEILQATKAVESRLDHRSHGIALRNLAKVMSWAGKHEEAYRAARRAVELAPDDLEAHYFLARCAQVLNLVAEAQTHYEQILKVDVNPRNAPWYHSEAHLNLGVLCERRGELEKAEFHYTRAIAMRPGFAEAHFNLGVVCNKRGNVTKAEAEFRSALAIEPEFPEACLNLGSVLEAQGKMNEAATQYRRALQVRPGYGKAAARLQDVLQKQGNR